MTRISGSSATPIDDLCGENQTPPSPQRRDESAVLRWRVATGGSRRERPGEHSSSRKVPAQTRVWSLPITAAPDITTHLLRLVADDLGEVTLEGAHAV